MYNVKVTRFWIASSYVFHAWKRDSVEHQCTFLVLEILVCLSSHELVLELSTTFHRVHQQKEFGQLPSTDEDHEMWLIVPGKASKLHFIMKIYFPHNFFHILYKRTSHYLKKSCSVYTSSDSSRTSPSKWTEATQARPRQRKKHDVHQREIPLKKINKLLPDHIPTGNTIYPYF